MSKHILVTFATLQFINAERETVRLVDDVETIFSNTSSNLLRPQESENCTTRTYLTLCKKNSLCPYVLTSLKYTCRSESHKEAICGFCFGAMKLIKRRYISSLMGWKAQKQRIALKT